MKKLLICAAVLILAASCSKELPPERVVEAYFNALIQEDYKKADSYLISPSHETADPSQKKFMSIYAQSLTYSDIKLVEKNEIDATVSAIITSIDMEAAYLNFENDMLQNDNLTSVSEDELEEMLFHYVISNINRTETSNITARLIKTENGWKIESFGTEEPDFQYELTLIDKRTEILNYLEADKDASICIFQNLPETDYIIMFCSAEDIKTLETKTGPVNISYEIYIDNMGSYSYQLAEIK